METLRTLLQPLLRRAPEIRFRKDQCILCFTQDITAGMWGMMGRMLPIWA